MGLTWSVPALSLPGGSLQDFSRGISGRHKQPQVSSSNPLTSLTVLPGFLHPAAGHNVAGPLDRQPTPISGGFGIVAATKGADIV
jgi:hypothetical protein